MLQYVVAGLVLGGIYAIAAAGLVVTYLSAGILNFSFGALAYFVARCYYFLNSQHHWSIAASAAVSILVVGPALGAFLYVAVFRLLRLSSTLVKLVATLGLSVIVPAAAAILFGRQSILKAPGLAPQPVRVFDFIGVPVTMDQLIVYACVVAVVVAGALVIRRTDAGLRVRAMVDSPAMTALSGTDPGRVALGVWSVSVGLAGLVGVLSAPVIGLDPGDFTLLMVAAFAAVVAARLRSLPVAVTVGLAMGIANALVLYALPPSSSLTLAVLPSIPFIVTAGFLVSFVIRGGAVDESSGVGGALDRAVRPWSDAAPGPRLADAGRRTALGQRANLVAFALVCLLPLALGGFWVGLVGQGVAFAIIFLSFSLVTGEGGMIWLCQVTFAGIGALTMGLLAVHYGWPVMLAVLGGGLAALPFGLLIGAVTIRLGDLYVALVTLIFGLLMENLLFTRPIFQNQGIGVNVTPPQFASGSRAFAYLCLGMFAIVAAVIVNVRRSTTGLALAAVRGTEPGAKTIGIGVLAMKVLVAGLAAFVAGIGGAMLGLAYGVALPSNYGTLQGVFWLVVLVTLGIRSNMAALFAGLLFSLLPGITLVYLPTGFGNVLPLAFGIGALRVARFPDGWLTAEARRLSSAVRRLSPGRRGLTR